MQDFDYKYITKTKDPSNLHFGVVFTFLFLIIALYPLLVGGSIRLWSLFISGIFLLLAFTAPKVLTPANRIWMKFGELIHFIVSPVALAVIFYGSILPTGLILRVFRKDLMRLRLDSKTDTYWIKRDPPGPSGESFNNQF
jgi:hypothetical protein